MEKIRVSIIENEKAFSDALKLVLNNSGDIEVVSTHSSAEHALSQLMQNKPDVALVDIELGSVNLTGIDCIMRLKPELPTTEFMVLTIYEDHQNVFDALAAGAMGYILKGDRPEKIISSIFDIKEGGSPMSPSIARKIVQSFGKDVHDVSRLSNLLTEREQQVIELISKGKIEKEVAAELYISIKTVKSHISNIYSKLQVRTRVEALNKYFGR